MGGAQDNNNLYTELEFCIYQVFIPKCENREEMVLSTKVISGNKHTSQMELLPLLLVVNDLLKYLQENKLQAAEEDTKHCVR